MFSYITRNNDEIIIDICDSYFKRGTIQIEKKDNQETIF